MHLEKNEFKLFLKKYFREHGFEKIKSTFYRNGKVFLCAIQVEKSYYGEFYYFDYYFFIGDFKKPYNIDRSSGATYTPYVGHRFYFNEEYGYSCPYLQYTPEQLTTILDENMNKCIYPPFEIGKKYLLENFENPYRTFLNKERIKRLLSE